MAKKQSKTHDAAHTDEDAHADVPPVIDPRAPDPRVLARPYHHPVHPGPVPIRLVSRLK